MRAVYRDVDTGRFVSRETWESSHGRGGDYVRDYIDYDQDTMGDEGDLGEDEY